MRTIQSRHEWIKSSCKTMSLYSETNNTICPYFQRRCEIAQKTHQGSSSRSVRGLVGTDTLPSLTDVIGGAV